MEEAKRIITKNASETAQIGEKLVSSGAKILCLYGELGSGKTTFARGYAKGLGIKTRLLSPTFIIVRRYELPKNPGFLYHIDLYRIKEAKELRDLGLAEIFSEPGSYVLVEWAEKLGSLLPEKRIDVRFTRLPDDSHEVRIWKKQLEKAINALKRGGIVIYPTDTAFGIGCRIDDRKAVDRLFRLRQRPITQPTPILVSGREQPIPLLDSPSDIVRHLMKTYWPGALTIVAKCKKGLIYSPIRGGGDTIGVRMPDHETALSIIAGVGVPILGPSANFHGAPTPYRLEDLDLELVKLVDFVLPGTCKLNMVSTVVDCTVAPCKIIRQGAVKLKL